MWNFKSRLFRGGSVSFKNDLKEGRNGKLAYMENHFDKRLDPRLLVEGVKSVVSLLYNYYPPVKQRENTYKISKYAYGIDYHFVIKDKLRELMEYINAEIGEVSGRVFTDSTLVLEGTWAKRAGIGGLGSIPYQSASRAVLSFFG